MSASPFTRWTPRASASASASSRSPATWPTGSPATTGSRERRFTHPRGTRSRYRTDGYGDYLFYAGRLEPIKRVDLALRALAASTSGARLKIAGQGSLEGELRRLAATLGVGERVDFLGFVSPEDVVGLYAGCRAAWYAPQDEDYGYVTIESFLSRKPVVTSTDAGGPLEFVEDGVTGAVAAPEPAGARRGDRPALRLARVAAAGDGRRWGGGGSSTSPGTRWWTA